MNTKPIAFLVLAILVVTTMSCTTGIERRKSVYRDSRIAMFSLRVRDFPPKDRDLLISPFSNQIRDLTEENWKGILGNLKFRKESSVGDMTYYIFDETELLDLVQALPPALAKMGPDQILVAVSKYNDVKGVVSKDHRTTFAVFENEFGLNLVFREIHADMPNVDTRNYYEWSVIPEFLLRNNYEEFRIQESDAFHYHRVEGFPNRLWVVAHSEQARKIAWDPRMKHEKEILDDEEDADRLKILRDKEKYKKTTPKKKLKAPKTGDPISRDSTLN